MSRSAVLGGELAELLRKVTWTRVQIEAGALPVAELDLADLPDRIAEICDAIAELPKNESRPYAGTLEKLIAHLDWLTEEVCRHRSAALERLALHGRPAKTLGGDPG